MQRRLGLTLGALMLGAGCAEPPGIDEESSTTGAASEQREDVEAPFVVVLGGWEDEDRRSVVVFERARVPGYDEGTLLVEGSQLVVSRGVAAGLSIVSREPGPPTLIEPALGHGWPPRIDHRADWPDIVDQLDGLDVQWVRWTIEGFTRATLITEDALHVLPLRFEVASDAVWWDGASMLRVDAGATDVEGGSSVRGGHGTHEGSSGSRSSVLSYAGSPFSGKHGCSGSYDCPGDEVCITFEVGGYAQRRCVAECYADVFQGYWCTDDASCCSDEHMCHASHCMTQQEADAAEPVDPSGGHSSSSSGSGCGSNAGSEPRDGCNSGARSVGDGCNACADAGSDVGDACSCRTRGPSPNALLLWTLVALVIRRRRA